VSSRLALDSDGRLVAIGTSAELQGQAWVVLGDTIAAAGTSIFFLANETRRESRPATSEEQLEAKRHAPYRAGVARQEREQQATPDDLLAEQEAIRLARLEQQRTPADLLNAA
jgi:hypothetical protein